MAKPTPIDKEIILDPSKIIISKTDKEGKITYINEYFCEISGYSQSELVGANHNIIRHPDMPAIMFKMLWESIKQGDEFKLMIKNLSKSGAYYWVLAHIKPHIDPVTKNIEYYTGYRRAVPKTATESISKLYKHLKEKEVVGGLDSSRASFEDYLKLNGVTYERYLEELAIEHKEDDQPKSMFGGLKGMFTKK